MMRFKTLKDHVYDYLSRKIQEGSIKPGDKINELDISGELNISRTPVREALIELSASGLLISEPRKGFRVKPIDDETARNLYLIIGSLDALAAEQSLEHMEEEDFEHMEKLIQEMDEAIEKEDYDRYYQLQLSFHDVYTEKSNNEDLIEMLHTLKMRFMKQGYTDDEKLHELLSTSNEQHKSILKLMKKKDAAALSDYVKNTHWDICHSGLDVL